MDPVSALSVAGVALQLVGLCVSVSQSLSSLKDKYDEAGKTIRGIKRYCKVIEFAVRKVQHWIETTVASSGVVAPELAALQFTLQEYTEVVQDLKDDVDKIVGSADEDTLRRGQKFKFVWNQDIMQQHLQELHYLSSALHLLLDATQLPLDRLGDIVEQTRENSRSISSSRRSLKSFQDLEPVDAAVVQFAFNEVLTSSAVYQRAAAYALAASIDVDSDSDRSGVKVERLIASSPGGSTSSAEDATPIIRGPSSLRDLRLPARNERFQGREDIMETLHDTLHCKDLATEIRICALYGLGGIGKTEIAVEYAYRHHEQSSSNIVWWVHGESPTSIAMSYSSLSEVLGFTTSTEPTVHVSLVKKWLGLTKFSWLLVFDDFDSEITQLQQFLPDSTKGQGSVVITTRRLSEISWVRFLEVPPWTRHDAISFLLELDIYRSSTIAKENMIAAGAVADALACLPLALAQAAHHMKRNYTSLSKYLETYTTHTNKLMGVPAYGPSITETFSLATSDLSADATGLLQALAFLDTDGLDESSLLSEITTNDTAGTSDSNPQPALILTELVSRSLVHIERDGNSRGRILMHRLVQNFILGQFSNMTGPAQAAFQHAIDFVRKHMPNTAEIRTSSKADLLQHEPVYAHAVSLALKYTTLQGVLRPSVEFSELLIESAACMARTERLEEAKQVLGVANRTLEQLDVPADNALRMRAVTMQRFFDDWGV